MTIEFIAIGTSLGGLRALKCVFNALPVDFPVPIAVVIHRQADADNFLPELLQKHSAIPVFEANDKTVIKPGTITLAPGDYHLLIDKGKYALSMDEPVSMARPSIDVLFESCADAFGPAAMGVILTGAGKDGAYGASKIKQNGGQLLVESPLSAESAAMPEAAIAMTATDGIYPLPELSAKLVRQCINKKSVLSKII